MDACSTLESTLNCSGSYPGKGMDACSTLESTLNYTAAEFSMASPNHPDLATSVEPRFQVCIIGDRLKQNKSLIESAECFQLPIVYSSSGLELINSTEFTTVFVLEEFKGKIFTELHKAGQKILGPTAVMQCAKKNKALPNNTRPLYTTAMKNVVASFSGFRSKAEMGIIINLIHHMGGSIRRDFIPFKTTHLIVTEKTGHSEKFQAAYRRETPIMVEEWVFETWARRDDVNFYATNKDLVNLCNALNHHPFNVHYAPKKDSIQRLPFFGCKLAFLGYQAEKAQHMADITMNNGGQSVDPTDPFCTHIVIEVDYTLLDCPYEHVTYILKDEWFWACIQEDSLVHERIYIYKNISGNKHKTVRNGTHQLAFESKATCYFSSGSDSCKNTEFKSSCGSSLNVAFRLEKSFDHLFDDKIEQPLKNSFVDMRSLTPRQQMCTEFFRTESNYVGILHTIITVFKDPLEKSNKIGKSLLTPAEIKMIFGNVPPIYATHLKIKEELTEVFLSRNDDYSIGNLILNHAHELMRSYLPFVNFFEKSKEVLTNCKAAKPRFHEFLKMCQRKPECGQTLQELFIKPFQRLPTVIQLLKKLLKLTPKSNADNQALEKAIKALKDIMMRCNSRRLSL